MSQVSKELVSELQTIIKEEYEKEVSYEEASKIANGLVGYFDTLAKIKHRNDTDQNKHEVVSKNSKRT